MSLGLLSTFGFRLRVGGWWRLAATSGVGRGLAQASSSRRSVGGRRLAPAPEACRAAASQAIFLVVVSKLLELHLTLALTEVRSNPSIVAGLTRPSLKTN